MALAINDERLLGCHGSRAQLQIAQRAILDLQQRRAPSLLDFGNPRITADCLDLIHRGAADGEELMAALVLIVKTGLELKELAL